MRKAFTLIEVLVVIAVIAILSVVVVLVLNPAQLLMQSRDANRVSDLATMTEALQTYATDQSNGSLGSSSVVYISMSDPSATSTAGDQCQGLGLASLPAFYTYHCAASSTLKGVNGAGWLPVNFTAASFKSPISSLPVDPINTSSSRNYYAYTTNGTQFEFTSNMESLKYSSGGSNDVITNDGGSLASVYEKGTKLGLEPLDYGSPSLVGYWNFEEGTGTVAYDYSGNNATGTWNGSVINGSHYTSGKIGSWAGNFANSNTNTISTSFQYSLSSASNFSWSGWIYITSAGNTVTLIGNRAGSSWVKITPTAFEYGSGGIMAYTLPTNTWDFVVVTKAGTNFLYYLNTVVVASTTNATAVTNMPFYIGGDPGFPSDGYLTGMIDDVRLYSQALSATQITNLYNGGK